MKKSVVALAVAAALAAPLAAQADTILYGSGRVSVDYSDEDPADGYWDVVNNDSRLGVMGSEDLGGGLSAVYQMEFGVDLTEGGNFESNRPKFVGLKGGFGTVTLGTQETPYYHVAGVTDIFNTVKSFGATAWLGGSFNGFSINPNSDRAGEGSLIRETNSLYYTTPEFSGFSAEAMLVMDGAANDSQGYSDGVDLWNIALKYNNGPFFAGASYIKLEGGDIFGTVDDIPVSFDLDMDQWVIGLGYTYGPFSVGFIYEQGSLNENGLFKNFRVADIRVFPNSDDAQNWYLTGQYTFGNNTIRAAYGQLDTGLDDDVVGNQYDSTIDNYLVGYQYNFSKRTSVWVEYIGRSADTLYYGDQNAVSIGTRVDF